MWAYLLLIIRVDTRIDIVCAEKLTVFYYFSVSYLKQNVIHLDNDDDSCSNKRETMCVQYLGQKLHRTASSLEVSKVFDL